MNETMIPNVKSSERRRMINSALPNRPESKNKTIDYEPSTLTPDKTT